MAVEVIEDCRVSRSNNTQTRFSELPLTFFDIPWLLFPPSNPLFFYKLHPMSTDTESLIIQRLKHSLSVALSHFYHLAGKLDIPPFPTRPSIISTENDSVSFSVARSDSDTRFDFDSRTRSDATDLKRLVPVLDADALLAVRVTPFGDRGFCIGLALRHVAADLRTFNNFMELWSRLCNENLNFSPSGLCYDREVIVDSRDLRTLFLNQWWEMKKTSVGIIKAGSLVRASFSLTPSDLERIKNWIPEKHRGDLYLNSYVLTCALLWVSLVNSERDPGESLRYFGYIAGGITRVPFQVPPRYAGNCVGFGWASLSTSQLLGNEGFEAAATAIGVSIKNLDGDGMLRRAGTWMSDLRDIMGSGRNLMVVGSPKVDLYSRDFGWGRPVKVEEVEIDAIKAVSLAESRDDKGGIEVSLVLPPKHMNAFTLLFDQRLNPSQPCFISANYF